MVSPMDDTAHDVPPITLGGHAFVYKTTLAPERDHAGAIRETRPQEHYAKRDTIRLNRYGHGPFCRFGITVEQGLTGVYALAVDGAVRYIGICEDLARRFNAHYGTISPQDCYVGGQSTNCKINHRVLDESNAGRRVDLYFYPTPQRKALEKHLIALYLPPWNH